MIDKEQTMIKRFLAVVCRLAGFFGIQSAGELYVRAAPDFGAVRQGFMRAMGTETCRIREFDSHIPAAGELHKYKTEHCTP